MMISQSLIAASALAILNAAAALAQTPPKSLVTRISPTATATSAPVEMQDGSGNWRQIGVLNPTTGAFLPNGAVPNVGGTMTGPLAGPQMLAGAAASSGTDYVQAMLGATGHAGSPGVFLAANGGSGGTFGTRSSDNAQKGSMGGFAVGSFGLNDNIANPQTVYGYYSEVRRKAGAGTTQGAEFDPINQGNVVDFGPYGGTPIGTVIAHWLSCGRTDVWPSNPCSVALGIVYNGAVFRKGIITASDALDTTQGHVTAGGIAVDMANGHHVKWEGGGGASIVSKVATAGQGEEQQFTDAGVQWVDLSGNPFLFVPSATAGTATLRSNLSVAGGLTTSGMTTTTGYNVNSAPTAIPAVNGLALYGGLDQSGSYGFGISFGSIDVIAPGSTDAFNVRIGGGVALKASAAGVAIAGRFNAPLHTPSSSSEDCTAGDSFDDVSYHYVCTATNTLKRVALSSF